MFTADQIRLPFGAKLLNAAGSVLIGLGVPVLRLEASSLMESAVDRTGFSNFGGDEFRAGLDVIVRSLEKEARLNLIGRIKARRECVRILSNRLNIEEDFRRHPEISKLPVRQPLFIVGLPRTGSTLLHNLLALDPGSRAPLAWELLRPSLPVTRRSIDPRIGAAKEEYRQLFFLLPRINTLHPFDPTAPEECLPLFQNCFESFLFSISYDVPTYDAWLLGRDPGFSYGYYRKQLQLLQWSRPDKRWVLKAPAHLFALPSLLAEFPDASLVQVHRDPLEALPSFCSLVAILQQQVAEGPVDLERIGKRAILFLSEATRRSTRYRASFQDSPFYDIKYEELKSDPISTVRGIYSHFGFAYSKLFERRMDRWLRENPQHKHGRHAYTLEQFGLTSDEVRKRFASYYATNSHFCS